MAAKLNVVEGKHKDREIPLPETIFLVGRDRQCHLRPHCELVSKLHCAIAAWAGKVRVRDLKSRNGTFLNGKQIDGEVNVALAPRQPGSSYRQPCRPWLQGSAFQLQPIGAQRVAHDRQHPMAVAVCIGESLERQQAGALAPADSVGRGGERE